MRRRCAGVRFRDCAGVVRAKDRAGAADSGDRAEVEFLEAGEDAREKLEAAVLAAEIDRAYLEWGLVAIEGLEIDGEAATPAALIGRGPLDLATEILARIKAECGLSEDERKN